MASEAGGDGPGRWRWPAGRWTDGDLLRRLAGEDVTFLLAANPGEPPLPLAKVASGGELARAMLAVRLVLLAGGRSGAGERTGRARWSSTKWTPAWAARRRVAVGRALAELGRQYQVIVVTHLAQVAAFADAQVAVSKVERDGRAVARARPSPAGKGWWSCPACSPANPTAPRPAAMPRSCCTWPLRAGGRAGDAGPGRRRWSAKPRRPELR